MVKDSVDTEQKLQDTSQQIVDDLESLIIALAGGTNPKLYAPAKLNISTFNNGKGTAMREGVVVDIIAHPAQILNSGDLAVGVPLKGGLYYIVGTI